MGLAWWYESNLTDGGDPCLQLILDRWNTRKELDYFAAREWETRGFTGMPGDEAIDFDENYEPHPGWRRELQNRPPIEELSPWGGGYNPLHLGHSDTVGYEKSHEKPMIHLDPKSRRAFLVINNFGSWQRDLDEFGKKLPDLGNRSWHVEVFDRSIGYLGRYRKSRETGLWFQGKHSLHMAGNPPGGKGIGLPLDLPSHDSKKNTA